MNADPKDDVALTSRATSLLAAGRREHIGEDAKAKLVTAVSLGVVGVGVRVATTAATSTRTLLHGKFLWILGGAGGLALALAVYGGASPRSGAEPVVAPNSASVAASSVPAAVPSETIATPETVPPTATTAVAPSLVPTGKPTSKSTATPSVHGSANTWEGEAESLATARGALRAGNAGEAHSRLDKYFATFPHGHLELEARVLRIRAYAKTDPARARREAESLRKAQPGSPYDDELKALAP